MTDTQAGDRAAPATTPPLFVIAVFTSAALVFMVQPMVAKLVLPMLGGSPAVWNTSMAFFQTALLAGYGYAHFLQKISSVRRQIVVHIAALALAGLLLPLRISGLLGEPSSTMPILWLLGVLTVSIGLPFAILSATAPLVQAWHARVVKGEGAKEPYALYAASNLGSLLALLAYPIIMEPLMTVPAQRFTWTGGYGLFVLVLAAVALLVWRSSQTAAAAEAEEAAAPTPAPGWTQRLIWIGLAAIPSSLMLGVTTHLTTDVASAPFLWVLPLALYLVTFIIAFQTKPLIHPGWALILQAAALPATAFLLPQHGNPLLLTLGMHLTCFFLTALVCHQSLVERRPDASHLTVFYLCLSVGGVVGGAFNAFVAPQVFNQVYEYPLILALAALARPRGGKLTEWELRLLITGMVAAVAAGVIAIYVGDPMTVSTLTTLKVLVCVTVISCFLLRRVGLWFTAMMIVLTVSSHIIAERSEVLSSQRSFFGVLRVLRSQDDMLGGQMKMLAHGTTLHGAQASDSLFRCQPMLYYARSTPIGQVFRTAAAQKPALRIGAVGLGTGTVATYVRPTDKLTFFEIDPLVIRMSGPGGDFTYVSECAKGPVDFVLGDARLTLAKQPDATYDVLLIDAFSSDAIPAHLLTVEAMRGYLTKLKPDGVIILHLSNRHLDLRRPALAVARKAGGFALLQEYIESTPSPLADSDETAVIVGRSREALAAYEAQTQWVNAQDGGVRPWTDDYTNLIGALWNRFRD